jgi:hypothetical protein|tara:strand:- start:36 stop:479 length:444 start_codon:yes stop_codon:yes gene_type:complete
MSYLDLDLSNVKVSEAPRSSLLDRGEHEVMIEGARVTKTSKGHDQLEVNYKNDKGSRKQWILFGHDNVITKDIALQELKSLLNAIGYQGSNPPDVGYYTGKPVKINIWKGKKDTQLSVKSTEKSANLNEVTSSDFSGSELDDEIPFG